MRRPRSFESRFGSLFASLLLLAPAGAARPLPPYEAQVVALQVTYQAHDEHRPWAKLGPRTRSAAAVVVDGPRLLTEAEIVRDATLIQVEKRAGARKVPARVVHVDPDIDLALLTVDDPGFFDDLEPVRIAKRVPAEGRVQTVRWKNRQLEVGSGRVARIEVKQSPFGSVHHHFLVVATDLSGGGWAEPLFREGEFIGLSASQDGQLASIIPAEIISEYVESALGDDYRGFAIMQPFWQLNQDHALAAYLRLEGAPRGVVLRKVPWGSTGCEALEPRDVLLSIGGRPVDALGNYSHPLYGQLRFHNLVVDEHRPGDKISAQVLRDGEVADVEIELRRYGAEQRLIPWRRGNFPPPYLVAGGLVFRELDGNYLRAWGDDWRGAAPASLVHRYDLERESQTAERRRLLVLTRVLASAYNLGYHDLGNLALKEINGRSVNSIAEADEAFRHPQDGLHRVVFEPEDLRWPVVLDAEGFESATEQLLEAYDVPTRIRTRDGSATAALEGCSVRPEER